MPKVLTEDHWRIAKVDSTIAHLYKAPLVIETPGDYGIFSELETPN